MFVNLDLTQHTHISWYELISMLLSTDELRYQHKFRFNPDEKSIFIDWSGRPNDTTISDESCGLWLFVILCMWEPWPTPSPTSCLFHRPHSVFFFVRSFAKLAKLCSIYNNYILYAFAVYSWKQLSWWHVCELVYYISSNASGRLGVRSWARN